MAIALRAVGVLLGSLLLSACLVTPGKFDAALDIRADRQFAFRYTGEILASDMGKGMAGAPGAPLEDGTPQDRDGATGAALLQRIAVPTEGATDARPDADDDAQMQAIAAALLKEKGFWSARYLGGHKFAIDYAIAGRLDHAFLFPFNIDARIVLPFVAVELRGADRVRMKAPGFSNGFDQSQGPATGMGGPGEDAAKALDGTFTLTTDADIVSQNQEDGAQDGPQGRRIVWTITPRTSEAPAATLKLSQ